jgi:hypothetical protein
MSDNIAVLDGYTEEYFAASHEHEMPILVKPGTDFDSTFKAWDMDNQEYVTINGWLWIFTKEQP